MIGTNVDFIAILRNVQREKRDGAGFGAASKGASPLGQDQVEAGRSGNLTKDGSVHSTTQLCTFCTL